MKKKIISCILAMTIMLGSFGAFFVNAAESEPLRGMDYIVKRLTIFTHEDRANLETMFIPLLITDTGLNALIDVVEDYTPESESFMHVMLTKLLNRVEKEEVIKTLSYLYMVDEKVREEYLGGYYKRKELTLSEQGKAGMDSLMRAIFAEYPELEEVFEQDGITGGVIARVLKVFSEMNKNVPLFKKTLNGKLAVNAVDSELEAELNRCIAEEKLKFASAEEMLEAACGFLNEKLGADNMGSIIALGSDIGLILEDKKAAGSAGAGGKEELSEVKIEFNEETNELAVTGSVKNNEILENGEYKLFAVRFECGLKGYLADPDGEAVRLCAYEDGVWYAFLSKLGTYKVVETTDEYFIDADGWGKDYINALYERKIISGRGEGIFAPDDKITREEFVKLIVELFGLKGDFGEYFTDAKKGEWYYEYVSAAKFYDIVDGYPDKTFGVGKNITRQDMCKVLYSVMQQMGIDTRASGIALEFADRNLIADYAYPSVMALKKAGIVSGDDLGRFNPSDSATRQEAAKLIYNILLRYVKY